MVGSQADQVQVQFREREFAFTDEDFAFLTNMIQQKTGIVITEQKVQMVYGRVVRRIRALGLGSVGEYCAYLTDDISGKELLNFINAVTTNLTRFFREPHHFEHLKTEVLKPLKANPPADKRLRLWSAGCSLGMEAYSIAMTIADAIPDWQSWDIKILATDIDTNVLNRGKAGAYSDKELEQVPADYRRQFLKDATVEGEPGAHVKPSLRNMVHFKQLNFLDPWPVKGPFDVVFCRNVIIYFDKDLQREIFKQFANVMPAGSHLYIGHSENLHGISDAYQLLGNTVYQRKGGEG